MKRLRTPDRRDSRHRIILFSALLAIFALGATSLAYSMSATAEGDASIDLSYTSSGELLVIGTGFDASTNSNQVEVATATAVDNAEARVESTTTNEAGTFTQVIALPNNYKGPIGVISTTENESASATLVIE